MKTIACVVFCLFVMSQRILAVDAPMKEYDYEAHRFKISVPTDWKEIPREELDRFSNGLATMSPNVPKQYFAHGFQLAANEEWFAYPYVLIQLRQGRVGAAELNNMKTIQSIANANIKEMGKDSEVFSNMSVGEMVYDEPRSIVWLKGSMDISGVGPVETLAGMILTNKGMISVGCSCLKADIPKYGELFRNIMSSVKIDDLDRYIPDVDKSGDQQLIGQVLGALMGMAIIWWFKNKLADSRRGTF